MSSKAVPKKKKLSLSNKQKAESKSSGSQTIFAMFKKQQEKLTLDCKMNEEEDEKHGTEDDNTDAVLITKVEQSLSGSMIAELSKCRSSGESDEKTKSKDRGGKRLSLSKQKKQNAKSLDDGKAFLITEQKNTSRMSSKPQNPYRLRRRRTVPLVMDSDISDGEEDGSDDDDVIITGSNNMKTDVLKTRGSTFIAGKVNKSDKSPGSSKRLSLKRHRTDGDVPKAKVKKMLISDQKNEDKTSNEDENLTTGSTSVTNCYKDNEGDVICVSKSDQHTSGVSRTDRLMKQKDRLKLKSPSKTKRSTASMSLTGSDGKVSKHVASTSKTIDGDDGKGTDFRHSDGDCADRQLNNKELDTVDKSKTPENKEQHTIGKGNTPEMKHESSKKNKDFNISIRKKEQNNRQDFFKKGKLKDTDKTSKKAKDVSVQEVQDPDLMEEDESMNGESGNKLEEVPGEGPYRIPYFLENFRTIMNSVLGDDYNAALFDERDMDYINKFNSLTEPCQKLYIRIFSRKLSWLPVTRINYPEISDDIPGLVSELTSAGLLHSGDKLQDLRTILKILSAPDLKALAKSFHLNVTTATKVKLVEMLEKKSQQSSISSMFTGGGRGNTMEKTMLDRARSYLGQVCRLVDEARAVYMRLLMLFSLYHTNFDEDSNNSGQGQQLFQMLMVNIGRVVYPSYTVNRQRAVFADRDALVRFETALQFEMDLQILMEKGRWVEAYELYVQAQQSAEQILKDDDMKSWDASLPEYLRLYSAGSAYTRIRHMSVEILQRRKDYREAVSQLQALLDQALYCPHYRGHWYERLTLNLDAHLKAPGKCLEKVRTALHDPTVRAARRLAVYERGQKICEAPKSKFAEKLKEIEGLHSPIAPTRETSIEGMVLSDAGQMGVKYQFVMEGDTDSVTLCAVEELVLNHYKHHGYPDGLHAEGSIISNLCTLLLWDIVYMPVADVFYSPYQACPLDITTQDFYINRKEALDMRLAWIKEASIEELCGEVERVWEAHNGTQCMGLNWERFSGPETHKGLVSCMGGEVIAGILDRFVKDPRHTRSGFPDLTLWNTETKQFKICEVKGPTDRLSYKQILWIDYLIKLGVDAEVCYVKAVCSKKLKPSSSR